MERRAMVSTTRKKKVVIGRASSSSPPAVHTRRSSRLQNVTPVTYEQIHVKKNKNPEEGKKEEDYTEEHDKLLGICKKSWTLFKDGYDKDGKPIYDPIKGKSCHQCRWKTVVHHTSCSKCSLILGQLCGDCLYMRYGENVLEVKNPKWICPICQGICNCNCCRIKKGWAPTGSIYKKVLILGFKSIAHYLIQTCQSQVNSGNLNASQLEFSKKSLPLTNTEDSSQLQRTLV